MSHNDPVNNKTAAQTRLAITREDFLTALFDQANSELLLEMRCIHPETEAARVLWSPVGDPQRVAATMRQADALNKSGHGVFFAPCLRDQKKGSAEAAALVPALWVDIDCDDDPQLRASALQKLHDFDPKPSIILDSGGGWHSYWLLNPPVELPDDATRQHIASVLHGLFTAVGGDEEYAKSVASLMRLPDTVNTKPDRAGVVSVITEFHPDRRYPLDAFEWLAVKPSKSNGTAQITHSGNGHTPLPQITQDYLSHGASNGNRNRALFDAACQFRDAGYSQAEAEAELIPRHVADGTGDENPTAREREARATIASVYSQSPRDPIAEPVPDARQTIDRLVSRYGTTEKQDQPTSEQIAEAVKACAHLEAIDWAVQRQRLKDLCGREVRLSDLDRQYRQAHKMLERERIQDYAERETYFEADGSMIYHRETYRGPVEKTVASWSGCVVERISQVTDDGQMEHITALELRNEQQTITLQVPSEMFGDDAALRRFIAGRAGEAFTVRAGMGKHLAPAILSLSGDYPYRTCYNFMGWHQIDGRWTYVAPGICINADGVLTDPPQVELDSRLRDYNLQDADWQDSLAAFEAMLPVFPKQLAPTCIAFALLPLVQSFFPSVAPRPAIHLTGTYSSGKSVLAALMSSFYGSFSRDTPPAQWGDTINTVEAMGHPLASALYWVDDYKNIYADERTFTRFLQSYSRGMGRGRLTREAKLRKERACRGTILSTGETVLEGEASVLSRMLVLNVPPWEQRDPAGKALDQADMLRQYLPGFTVKFATWIANQVEERDLPDQLSRGFAQSVAGYRDKLQASGITMANTGRVIQNWAVLVTVYRLVRSFLTELDADHILPSWQDVILETAQTVHQERASQVFLDLLGQVIAGGQAILDDDMRNPREVGPGKTVVGYRDANFVYLLPEIAYKEIIKVQPLRFNVSAIGKQLHEDGYLVPGNSNSHLTVQMRVRDNRVRLWRLKSQILTGDSGDDGDTHQNEVHSR